MADPLGSKDFHEFQGRAEDFYDEDGVAGEQGAFFADLVESTGGFISMGGDVMHMLRQSPAEANSRCDTTVQIALYQLYVMFICVFEKSAVGARKT